jgi:hypothetical protein
LAQNGQVLPSETQHRRETRRQIWLPIGVVLLVLLVCLGFVMSPAFPPVRRDGVSLVADWMLTILVLCPAVICLFALAVGGIVSVVLMNRLHDMAATPLRRAELLTETLKARVESTGEAMSRKSIDLSARWAYFDRLLSIFDRTASSKDE